MREKYSYQHSALVLLAAFGGNDVCGGDRTCEDLLDIAIAGVDDDVALEAHVVTDGETLRCALGMMDSSTIVCDGGLEALLEEETLHLRLKSAPESVWLRVMVEKNTLVDSMLIPTYLFDHPNGPECGPECQQGSVSLAIRGRPSGGS